MEVILLEKLYRRGNVGDTVKVKDGFAYNYLIPQGKALPATPHNKQMFEERKSLIQKQNEEKKQQAEAVSAQLNGLVLDLYRQAGEDGKLFGSITSRDIVEAIQEQSNTKIARSNIELTTPIKFIGEYSLKISLYPEVENTITIQVQRTEIGV